MLIQALQEHASWGASLARPMLSMGTWGGEAMNRLATSSALILLTACGETQQSCEIPTYVPPYEPTTDPSKTVVPIE